jgi:hypothetical protein
MTIIINVKLFVLLQRKKENKNDILLIDNPNDSLLFRSFETKKKERKNDY